MKHDYSPSTPIVATLIVLAFTILWRFVNRVIGPKISVFFNKRYLDFDGATRLVWNTYVTSTIHSIVVLVLTFILLKCYPEISTTERYVNVHVNNILRDFWVFIKCNLFVPGKDLVLCYSS